MEIPILYRDEELIAVNKPSGLLVHRTQLDHFATEFAMQTVRDQIGQMVYPVHRLDKPTSGVLIFALSPDAARGLSEKFSSHQIKKTYVAVVRGIPIEQQIEINYPLKEELDEIADKKARQNKPPQEAITEIKRLAEIEIPVQVDRYPTSRYALVQAIPKTGRKHQIRRHLRHLGHPIIGDINYGVGKHSRFFEETYGIRRLLLACTEMSFQHPKSGDELKIKAPLSDDFVLLLKTLGWENACS